MSLTLVNHVAGATGGVQPTIAYPAGNIGDICIIHYVSRILSTVADTNGKSLYSIDASGIVAGTVTSYVLARIMDGTEGQLQFTPAFNPASTPLPIVYQVYRFSGQSASPYDGTNHALYASGQSFIYADAITTAPNSLVLLLGGCYNVITAGIDNDAVSGFTKLGKAYDQFCGVVAYSTTQAAAGHTGGKNGSQNVSTGGLATDTVCLFSATGSGGGGGASKARNFAVTIG